MKSEKDKYIWRTKDKEIISCDEKNKILNENINEFENMVQSLYDDAVLMGCDACEVKLKILKIVKNIKYTFE
mgnify:CR=1 FL=1|tara:strand:+ start:586 stop:801 length:216 start_codon:yes stop_codon:yes gene_type:complete